MSEIKLIIDHRGERAGTIGWLAGHAASLKVGETTTGESAVWLKDHNGGTIECLAMIDNEEGLQAIERDVDLPYGVSASRRYTDAAWAVIKRLANEATELLEEPEEMAEAYSVTIVPRDALLAAMLKAAADDPAVRPAIIDYVNNDGD